MALNGSFSKGVVNDHYTLRVDWTAVQSITDNTSTITAKVYYVIDPYYSINLKAGREGSITINGTKYSFTTSAINSSGGTTHLLYTATHTIHHNSDGTASISLSCSWGMNASIYLSATNTNVWVGDITASANYDLNQIPRLSELTVLAGMLGEEQTLTVDQKSRSFTHKVLVECGPSQPSDYSEFIVGTDTTTSSEISILYTPPVKFAQYVTSGTSVSVKYTIFTYNGGTELGNHTYYVNYTIPESVKPTCSIVLEDADDESIDISTYFGDYIKGKSKVNIILDVDEAYGSEIASYQITVDGTTHNSQTVLGLELQSSGDITISAKVVDKRGRVGTSTQTITVLDYSSPKITKLKVERCELSNDGTYVENIQGKCVRVTYSGSVAPLNTTNRPEGGNTAAWVIKYGTPSAGLPEIGWYLGNSLSVTDGTYIFEAETGSSYDIVIEVTDYFDQPVTRSTSVSTAFAIMHFNKNGRGLAFGKVSEEGDEFLDIGMNAVFRGTVNGVSPSLLAYPIDSIYISYSHESPASLFGGKWTRVYDTDKNIGVFLYACTEDGTIGEFGGEAAHTLTIDELPSHQHTLLNYNGGGTTAEYSDYAVTAPGTVGYGYNVNTSFIGGGAAHNNMPPFVKVSVWRRIE